jgi:hypothetical protein
MKEREERRKRKQFTQRERIVNRKAIDKGERKW